MHSLKKLALIFITSIGFTLSASTRTSYIAHLPSDSVIRQKCESCSRSLIPFLKSNTEVGCNRIEEILARRDTEDGTSIPLDSWWAVFIMSSNSESLKAAIRKVLENENDELKWAEYHKVVQTAEKIREQRKERIAKQKDQEVIEKEKENNRF